MKQKNRQSNSDTSKMTGHRTSHWLRNQKAYQSLRFCLYIVLIVLLNASALYFSLRIDLTKQKTYSLAPVSTQTVAQLEEPVTIRAYFSSNLPSTYNILSSLVRDLLQTYASRAPKGLFNYEVNIIDSEDQSEKSTKLREEAEKYGIYPVQLQGTDGNEFKAISAYVGLVITQGENQEVISPLQPRANIQYNLTATLQRMTRKSGALLSLTEPLQIYYYFSPLIARLEGGAYADFPNHFEAVIQDIEGQMYGKIESQVIDPDSLPPGFPNAGELGLPDTEVTDSNGVVTKVYSAVVINNEGVYKAFSLLQLQPTLQLGPQGFTQSNTVNIIDPAQLEGQLVDIAIASLGITQNIGYVADRGTATTNPPNPQQPNQGGVSLYSLSNEINDLYSLSPVQLGEGIGKNLSLLLLVEPTEQLSDWDLYQLDQFVMRGGGLIVALQPYQMAQSPYGYGIQYISNPNIVGSQSEEDAPQYTLKDLLEHYGIIYENALVFDQYSYVQRGQNSRTGSYEETPVYYIPEIRTQWGADLPFIKDLKTFFMMSSASLKVVDGSEAMPLIRTSTEAWVEKMDEGNKDLNAIIPPAADSQSQQNLVVVSPRILSSFFDGKDIPEKPEPQEDEEDQNSENETLNLENIQDGFIKDTQHGRVLVSGSSMIFDGQLLGVPNNKALALNLLDYMADNLEMANLRARNGSPNLIDPEVETSTKNFVKWFNIIGLPICVGIFGILMLISWRRRQRRLRRLFHGITNSETIQKSDNTQELGD